MPSKDCSRNDSWPEDQPDNVFVNGNFTQNDDDDDDDDLFQDDVWERIDAQNIPHALDDGDDYILLNQVDQNPDGQQRLYQHNYQVQWIDTDEPLFNTDPVSSNDPDTTSQNQPNNQNDENVVSQQPGPSSSSSSSSRQIDEQLDKEKIDVIKNLMSNFKLPDENFPSWAKEIPEDEWKKCLDKKLKKSPK